MPIRRVTLEPIGRFAFLAVGVHVLLGGLLWWWLSKTQPSPEASPGGKGLTWVSPADFAPPPPTTPAAAPVSPPPVVATTPVPAPVPAPVAPVVPAPAPSAPPAMPAAPAPVAAAPVPAPAPVASAVPNKPAAPPAENTHDVPKAIGLDPAQALAIMAKARAAEAAAAAAKAPPAAPAPVAAVVPAPPPVPSPPPAAPATATASAPAMAPAPAQPAVETARFVTVSLKTSPAAPKQGTPKVASLLDMATLDAAGTGATGEAKGVRLDEVDRAIIDAFMREWLPPDASKLPRDHRTAHLEMAVNREGKVLNFKLMQPSGSIDLDMSVLEAADRLDKIGASLPATFPKERYEFQVNLHAE